MDKASPQQILPHQQRVVEEKDALDGNIAKLGKFFDTPMFAEVDREEQVRLATQINIMRAYSFILAARINAF